MICEPLGAFLTDFIVPRFFSKDDDIKENEKGNNKVTVKIIPEVGDSVVKIGNSRNDTDISLY